MPKQLLKEIQKEIFYYTKLLAPEDQRRNKE